MTPVFLWVSALFGVFNSHENCSVGFCFSKEISTHGFSIYVSCENHDLPARVALASHL